MSKICYLDPMKKLLFLLLLSSTLHAQDGRYMLNGRNIFVPKLGSKEALTPHPRLNGVISKLFNRPGEFHGPNCYNTSLIASGLWSNSKKRYVSPEEFESILKNNFKEVSNPNYGDVIVYDAKMSRGHAAFFLGDNLVFHKKSFGTHYHYRIVESDKVGVVEENEWVPGPMDDSSMQMDWPELGKKPKSYYRLTSRYLPKIDSRFDRLLTEMEKTLEADLKVWAMGKRWGMVGEYFMDALLSYARAQRVNKYTEGLIISMKDQLYVMIEEMYFKHARSAARVLEDICLPEDTTQIFGFIRELGRLQNKPSGKIEEALKKLSEQDRSRCSLRMDAVLSKI